MSGLFDLSGKVALMTGASKGIGKAMAIGLAEHGCRVMISSRKMDACQQTAEEINKLCGGERVLPFACHAGQKDQLQALVDATRKQFGPIDVLIGNAGVNPFYGSMSELPDEAYDKTMSTNVKANHWLTQMVIPDMIKKGGGSLIFTASVAAFNPSLVLGAYGISKTALVALMRNLAAELGPKGIRANAICPALIKTNFARALWEAPEAEQSAKQEIPLRRLGEPDDLKGLAVFLASDASGYITGQALTVCGGAYMYR